MAKKSRHHKYGQLSPTSYFVTRCWEIVEDMCGVLNEEARAALTPRLTELYKLALDSNQVGQILGYEWRLYLKMIGRPLAKPPVAVPFRPRRRSREQVEADRQAKIEAVARARIDAAKKPKKDPELLLLPTFETLD